MDKNINIALSKLDEGALQERFDHELKNVVENILDPNTEYKKKRKITVDIEIATDEYRDQIYLSYEVKAKLAPREKRATKAVIGMDMKGNIHANELKSGQPGQMYFDTEDSTLKTDTGEPVEQIEQNEKTEDQVKTHKEPSVLNFRAN